MKPLPIYPEVPRAAIEDATPRDLDSACRACKLGTDSVRNVCMPAAALDQSKGGESMGTLLVITASPTQKDDRVGRPLTGDAGAYLRKQLAAWEGVVVYDHALRCPIGTKKPTSKYYEACRGYLASMLVEAKPDRVILVGTEAVNAFMGRGLPTMSVSRGYGHLSDGTPVFIVVPPGPAMRNRFVRGWLDDDLKWAMTTNPERAPLGAVYFMVDSVEMAEEAEVEARFAGGFTSDLETFGSPYNEEQTILTVGVTPFDEPTCYVWEKKALEDPEIRAPYLRMLIDPSLPKGGQNWKFDCVHIQSAWDVVVRGTTFCTKLMTRIQRADADAKLANLQAQVGMIGGKDEAAAHVDTGVKELRKMIRKPEIEPKAMAGIERWKLDLALDRIREGDEPKVYAYAAIPGDSVRPRYCGTDCISTDRLRVLQESQMEDWQRRVWDETGRALNDAVVQMECNGIAVSRAAVGRLREFCDVEITEHSAVLSQYVSPDFNSNSTAQVGKLLFETLGLANKGRTKTGYKTGAEILAKLEHPAAKAILGLRKAGKFRSQYADGMAFFIRDDGRIHPSINQDGTETSRLSCSRPNLFNIPRPDNERGKLARDVYVAPKGRRLIEADYSQIELRVAAMLSGDQVMIEMFKRGVDFHLETAKLIAPIFGLNPDDIDDEHPLRSRAKTVVFACVSMDTKILTNRGWLSHEQVRVGDMTRGKSGWVKILEVVKYDSAPVVDWQGFRVTPNHRWWSDRRTGRNTNAKTGNPTQRGRYYVEEFTTLETATSEHRIQLSMPFDKEDCSRLTEQEAGILGWIVTDGHYGENQNVSIYQSMRANPDKVREIDALLEGVAHSRWPRPATGMVQWALKDRKRWRAMAQNLDDNTVLSMGTVQRAAFVRAGVLAEGYKSQTGRDRWSQNPGRVADAFLLAFHLEGHHVRVWPRTGTGKYADREHLVMSLAKPYITGQRLSYEDVGQEAVWCVRTEDETWTMKRGHAIAITGNTLYGDPVAGLAAKLNIHRNLAARLQASILGQFLDLKKWIDGCLRFGRQNGYCHTYWNGKPFHRRPLWRIADQDDAARETAERSTWNSPIQGSAASYTNASLGRFQQVIDTEKLPALQVLTIYDSIVLDCDEAAVDDVAGRLVEVMTGWDSFGVPLKVDVKVGEAWGSMSRIEVV